MFGFWLIFARAHTDTDTGTRTLTHISYKRGDSRCYSEQRHLRCSQSEAILGTTGTAIEWHRFDSGGPRNGPVQLHALYRPCIHSEPPVTPCHRGATARIRQCAPISTQDRVACAADHRLRTTNVARLLVVLHHVNNSPERVRQLSFPWNLKRDSNLCSSAGAPSHVHPLPIQHQSASPA